MAYQPTGHHVLVRPEKIEEKSKGGIYIPTAARENEQNAMTKGEVVAIGPNAWKAFDDGSPWAKVGDTVVFARYGGKMLDPLKEGGESLRLLNDEDILAVITA